MTQCKHHPKTPSGFASNYRHQCKRKAVKDGLCAIHQPNYTPPRQLRAIEQHEAELESRFPGRQKLLDRIEAAKAAQVAARGLAERVLEEANAERHNAELALRRLQQGTPEYSQ
jgi:hypothetical protein